VQLFAELSKMQRAFFDLLALPKVILTIPVASVSAERSFSAMRRVKSHLRASMSATRTSDLTLITVERQLSGALFDDPESAIDTFAHAESLLNENTVQRLGLCVTVCLFSY